MAIKKVVTGETYSRDVKVNGLVVERNHVTKHDTMGKLAMKWFFDFVGVSQKELLELASATVIIAIRNQFKGCSKAELDSWDNKVISVREFLDMEKKRTKKSPEASIVQNFGKLTEEERKELLRKLAEM